jgi:Tol biopolymer transport system component
MPAFSPDGGSVAFVRLAAAGAGDVHVQPVEGGEARQITFGAEDIIWDLDWTPDGKNVVFTSQRGGPTTGCLRTVSIDGGEAVKLSVGENARFLSVAPAANRLVCSRFIADMSLWRVQGPSSEDRSPPTKFIASSTRVDGRPQYSPDGAKVTFYSDRSGAFSVWICEIDGTDLFQLTPADLPEEYHPAWSPDGTRIAFGLWMFDKESMDIFVTDAEGGIPRNLTDDDFHNVEPVWSPDGRWIFYASGRPGYQIMKIAAEGGESVQLTEEGGLWPIPGDDGKFVYFRSKGSIWHVPVEGGDEEIVLEGRPFSRFNYWSLWKENIVYISAPDGGKGPSIEMFNLSTRETTELVSLTKHDPGWGDLGGITVSPDGRWILYTDTEITSDLMLVENFR